MAKGKTQFTCTEKRIDRGKWRWTVSYLGECLGTGIAKTQDECRENKDRVKDEWLAKNVGKVTEYTEKGLANKFIAPPLPNGEFNKQNFIFDRDRKSNLPEQYIPSVRDVARLL